MCLILQGTRVQVQVLKLCKSVQELSEEVMFFKARHITRQMYLSRFKVKGFQSYVFKAYVFQSLSKAFLHH